jgi:tRNA dimethylallyltransferase
MRSWLEGTEHPRAVLLAGPTASGKSHAALEIVEEAARNGRAPVIINADSMQVYDALSVLTARPSGETLRRAPHRLYGYIPAATRYSVGAWLRDATPILSCDDRLSLPIVVGGTGLYFKALTEGLAELPAIPPEIRAEVAARAAAEGIVALHTSLAARDPNAVVGIRPNDAQRVLRAVEVIAATGRSLQASRSNQPPPLLDPAEDVVRIVFEPSRAALHGRIERRLDRMVAEGAMEEVEALVSRRLDPDLPIMKAIGVRPFAAALRGEISVAQALLHAQAETRRYAKRQGTWFRHQMPGWRRVAV